MTRKNDECVDLEFRPEFYWDESRRARANIKGEWRRKEIRRALESHEGDEIPKELFAEGLSDHLRDHLGAIQPEMMGGEYLPDYNSEEVEIARISYASTTADVVSVRAWRDGDLIRYRVVDEYGLRHERPEPSREPLPLREVVHLIDDVRLEDSNLIEGLLDLHYGGGADLEHACKFITVTSEFYPTIERYFELRLEKWAESIRQKCQEERRLAEQKALALERKLQSVKPKSPSEFPDKMTVDQLDQMDRQALALWLQKEKQLPEAKVLRRPPRVRWGAMAGPRVFSIEWQRDGTVYRDFDGPDYPTVVEAFFGIVESG